MLLLRLVRLLLACASVVLVVVRAQPGGDTETMKPSVEATTGSIAPTDPEEVVATTVPVDEEPEPTDAPTPVPKTLDKVVAGESDLSTLLAAVQAAGLVGTLNDTEFELTVFAPVNTAFEALPSGLVDKLLTEPWILHLTDLLGFHLTARTILTDEFRDERLEMINEEEVSVTVEELENSTSPIIALTSEFTDPGAEVIDEELIAENGVVHKIDAVLTPQWVATDALKLAGEVNNFATLVELVNLTDLSIPADGAYTLLAPNDQAFEALGREELNFYLDPNNTAALIELLSGHVFANVYPPVLLEDGQTLDNLAGTAVTVTINQRGGTESEITFNDDAKVEDVFLVSNGIVYEIDVVLMPATRSPSAENTTAPTIAPTKEGVPTSTSKAPAEAPAGAPTKKPSGDKAPTGDITLPPTAAPVNSAAISFRNVQVLGISCVLALFIAV